MSYKSFFRFEVQVRSCHAEIERDRAHDRENLRGFIFITVTQSEPYSYVSVVIYNLVLFSYQNVCIIFAPLSYQ
jgi:hypothetical protein